MRKLIILCMLVVQAISKPNGCVELCDGEQTSTSHGAYQSYNIQSAYSKELERFSSSGGRPARLEDLGVRNPIESDRPGNWTEADTYATDNGRGRVYTEHGQIINGPKTVRFFSKNYTSSWGNGGAIPAGSADHLAHSSRYFEEEFQKLRNEIRSFQDRFRGGRVIQSNSDSFNQDFDNQVETIRGHLDNFCKETNTEGGRIHSSGMNMSEEFERHVQRMREDIERWTSRFRNDNARLTGANQVVASPGHRIHASSSGYVKKEEHHYATQNGVPVQTQVPSEDYRISGRQRQGVGRNSNYNYGSSPDGYAQTTSQEQHYRQSSNTGRGDQQYSSPVYDENRVIADNQQRERPSLESRRRDHQYGSTGYEAHVDQQVREQQTYDHAGGNQQPATPQYDASASNIHEQTIDRQSSSSRQNHYYGNSAGYRTENREATQQHRANNYGQNTYQHQSMGYQTESQPGHASGHESQWSRSSYRRDHTTPQYTDHGRYNSYNQQIMQQQEQHQHQGSYQPGRTSTFVEETNESQIRKALTTQENQLVHGMIQLPDQWGKDGSKISTIHTIDCDTAEELAKQQSYRRNKRNSKYDESIDLNPKDVYIRNFEGIGQQTEDLSQQTMQLQFGHGSQQSHNRDFEQRTAGQIAFGRPAKYNGDFINLDTSFGYNQHRGQNVDEQASRTLDSMLEQQSEYLSKIKEKQEAGYNTRYGHFDQKQTVSIPDYYGIPQNQGLSGMSGNSHAQWQINGSTQKLENAHQIVSGHNEQQQEPLAWQVERIPQQNIDFTHQTTSNNNAWLTTNERGSSDLNQEEPTLSVHPLGKPAPKPTPRYSTPWQNSGHAYSTETENIFNTQKQITNSNRDTKLVNTPDIETNTDNESRDFRTDHAIVNHRESTTPQFNNYDSQSWHRHSVPIVEDFTQQIQQNGDLSVNDEFSQSQRARNEWFNAQSSNIYHKTHNKSNEGQIGNEKLGKENQQHTGQQVSTDHLEILDNVETSRNKDRIPVVSFQPRILEAYGSRGPYDPNHGDEVFNRVRVNPTATLPPDYEGDPWYIQVKPEESKLEERVISLEERPSPMWVEATVQTTTTAPSIWNKLGHKITTTYEKAKEKAKDIFG